MGGLFHNAISASCADEILAATVLCRFLHTVTIRLIYDRYWRTQRDTWTQTHGRKIYRQTDRLRNRQTDKWKGRGIEVHKEADRKTRDRQKDTAVRLICIKADGQIHGRETVEADKHSQTDKKSDRQSQ